MMTVTPGQKAEMLEAAKPLMAWIDRNCHPDCVVHVDADSAELLDSVVLVIK